MDFPGRLIAAFLAVILIIFFPLQYLAKTAENNIDSYIKDCTEQFSDDIRNKGYLDASTYEAYVQKLDTSGELYDIDLENIHPVTGEEVSVYDNKEEVVLETSYEREGIHVSEDQNTLELLENNLKVTGNVPLLFATNRTVGKTDLSVPINIEDNEIQSFATHTHTADCYVGHRHIDSCYYTTTTDTAYYKLISPSKQPDYRIYVGSYYSSPIYYYTYQICCYYCNSPLHVVTYMNWTDGSGRAEIYNSHGTFRITNTNPNFEYYRSLLSQYGNPKVPTLAELQNFNLISDVGCSCGNYGSTVYTYVPAGSKLLLCSIAQDETPICNQVVTSITPTNPVQSVKKGEGIITTATATYLDGHTGIVNCSSNFNPNMNGAQTVTLTYSGLVGNAKTTGTRTCTMSVTLINKTLSYITASPSSQIIKRYKLPTCSVTAYYSDGSSASIASNLCNYSALDNISIGERTLTISYTEQGITKSTSITVYVDDVVSIDVTPKEITVNKYTDVAMLPITVVAKSLYTGTKTVTSSITISGYNSGVIGDQNITISYHENGFTFYTTAKVHIIPMRKTCSQCDTVYDLDTDDTDPGCPVCKNLIISISVLPVEVEVYQGAALPISVQALYKNGSVSKITGWSSNYVPDRLGFQLVTIRYGAYEAYLNVIVRETEITCPICGKSYPLSEGSCPICRERVTGISVSPIALTVNQYESIDLNVTASYADGTTRAVTDWSIDCTTAKPGVYNATITYFNKTAKLMLTVLSQFMLTCPYCNTPYDSSEHPEGCPTCFKIITGIEAFSATGSNLVQLGATPDIAVVLIFKDTHREIAKDGYTIEGYHAELLGTQTVTVRYKTFSCSLAIEVVNAVNGIVCPKGHTYYPDEDGKDTGCPFCSMSEEHVTVYFYDITYLSEILEVIYTDGVYLFEEGNYLTVCATKRDLSLVSKIQRMFFKLTLLGRKRRFIYGGEVLLDG